MPTGYRATRTWMFLGKLSFSNVGRGDVTSVIPGSVHDRTNAVIAAACGRYECANQLQ